MTLVDKTQLKTQPSPYPVVEVVVADKEESVEGDEAETEESTEAGCQAESSNHLTQPRKSGKELLAFCCTCKIMDTNLDDANKTFSHSTIFLILFEKKKTRIFLFLKKDSVDPKQGFDPEVRGQGTWT